MVFVIARDIVVICMPQSRMWIVEVERCRPIMSHAKRYNEWLGCHPKINNYKPHELWFDWPKLRHKWIIPHWYAKVKMHLNMGTLFSEKWMLGLVRWTISNQLMVESSILTIIRPHLTLIGTLQTSNKNAFAFKAHMELVFCVGEGIVGSLDHVFTLFHSFDCAIYCIACNSIQSIVCAAALCFLFMIYYTFYTVMC